MNIAALFHQSHGATAYLVDAHQLRLPLHAAAGDLSTATVVTTDRYAGPHDPVVAAEMASGRTASATTGRRRSRRGHGG